MGNRFSLPDFVSNDQGDLFSPAGFFGCVLRGIGQVMLQNNGYAGFLFVAGVCYNSPLLGTALLLGAMVSTATAIALGADRTLIQAGLFGFNGGLVGIALLVFLQTQWMTWGYLILAAIFSSIIMTAMLSLMSAIKLPVLTMPFVVASLCFILAAAGLSHLQATSSLPPTGFPQYLIAPGNVTLLTIAKGIFNGIGQVFFQENIVTGILFTLGLAISSRIACAAALSGSLAGLLVAWSMGAAESAIGSGLYGFNNVLVAIALSSFFQKPRSVVLAYIILAMLVTPIALAAMTAALQPLGLPTLTLPFILITWLFLLAGEGFSKIHIEKSQN